MRSVVRSYEVTHLWAHQAQAQARNSGNTLYFDGDTIYSYGSHFPIARHIVVEGLAGPKKAILFTTRDYSVTTQHHKTQVHRAIPPSVPLFYTDNPRQSAVDVLEEYHAEIDNEIQWFADNLTKARGKAILSHYEAYDQACKRAAKLQEFLNDYRNIPPLPNFALVKAAVDKYKSEAKKRSDAAYAAAATRREIRQREWSKRAKAHEAEMRKTMPERVAQWRTGGTLGSGYGYYDLPTMLRIKGDTVETSKGATFPLEHAVKALPVVLALVRNGRAFQRNGHQIRLGHYQIDTIETDGTLHAGCHILCKEEIEHFAGLIEERFKISLAAPASEELNVKV